VTYNLNQPVSISLLYPVGSSRYPHVLQARVKHQSLIYDSFFAVAVSFVKYFN